MCGVWCVVRGGGGVISDDRGNDGERVVSICVTGGSDGGGRL